MVIHQLVVFCIHEAKHDASGKWQGAKLPLILCFFFPLLIDQPKIENVPAIYGKNKYFHSTKQTLGDRLQSLFLPFAVSSTTPKKLENTAFFLRLGLLSTLIRHEKVASFSKPLFNKNLNTPAFYVKYIWPHG